MACVYSATRSSGVYRSADLPQLRRDWCFTRPAGDRLVARKYALHIAIQYRVSLLVGQRQYGTRSRPADARQCDDVIKQLRESAAVFIAQSVALPYEDCVLWRSNRDRTSEKAPRPASQQPVPRHPEIDRRND